MSDRNKPSFSWQRLSPDNLKVRIVAIPDSQHLRRPRRERREAPRQPALLLKRLKKGSADLKARLDRFLSPVPGPTRTTQPDWFLYRAGSRFFFSQPATPFRGQPPGNVRYRQVVRETAAGKKSTPGLPRCLPTVRRAQKVRAQALGRLLVAPIDYTPGAALLRAFSLEREVAGDEKQFAQHFHDFLLPVLKDSRLPRLLQQCRREFDDLMLALGKPGTTATAARKVHGAAYAQQLLRRDVQAFVEALLVTRKHRKILLPPALVAFFSAADEQFTRLCLNHGGLVAGEVSCLRLQLFESLLRKHVLPTLLDPVFQDSAELEPLRLTLDETLRHHVRTRGAAILGQADSRLSATLRKGLKDLRERSASRAIPTPQRQVPRPERAAASRSPAAPGARPQGKV
jgi:hypothetical protein